MVRTLEKSEDKIQEICNILRSETLEPAKEEAERIIAEAQKERAALLKKSEEEAKRMLSEARLQLEKEKQIFHSSLKQAMDQCFEMLTQKVQNQLFNEAFAATVHTKATNPQVIADLLKAIIQSIEKEGVQANLSAIIPEKVSRQEVNALLGLELLKRLEKESVTVGDIAGGVQVRLMNKRLTLDISEEVLRALLVQGLRKDFRHLVFEE